MTIQFRSCRTCGISKSLGDYYAGPGGAFVRCKACCIVARKEAYRRNPEYTKALVRRYRAEAKARAAEAKAKATQATQALPASPSEPKATP